MVEAGTCYDHLAGRLSVRLHGALVDTDALVPTSEVRGDVGSGRFAFACPDRTKRMSHLGGALGAVVCERFLEEGWVRRLAVSRALELKDEGERALRGRLGLRMSRARGPCRVAEGTKEGEHS